jgi:hypothetical protein
MKSEVLVRAFDQLAFGQTNLLDLGIDVGLVAVGVRQLQVILEMPGFGLEQASVEPGQLFVQMRDERRETLADTVLKVPLQALARALFSCAQQCLYGHCIRGVEGFA